MVCLHDDGSSPSVGPNRRDTTVLTPEFVSKSNRDSLRRPRSSCPLESKRPLVFVYSSATLFSPVTLTLLEVTTLTNGAKSLPFRFRIPDSLSPSTNRDLRTGHKTEDPTYTDDPDDGLGSSSKTRGLGWGVCKTRQPLFLLE